MPNNYNFFIEDGAVELKQHINLSENAWLIISDDIKNFYYSPEKESFSGFLNTIFKNFYQQAEASITLRCHDKAEEIKNILDEKEFSLLPDKTKDVFIRKFVKIYEKELLNKNNEYSKGSGEKFRINKENLDILRDSLEGRHYNGAIRLYLKSIFEEYSTKPAFIREQIFFNDIFYKINLAITNEKKLKITLLDKISAKSKNKYQRKFYVTPFKIVQDKTNNYNYLVGFSEEIKDIYYQDENGIKHKTSTCDPKQPACFRISRISKAEIQSSMGAHISKENIAKLTNMIIERGPQYLTGEPIDITIKFSDKGLENFRRHLYLRPQFYTISKEDKHIYTFKCTEMQAIAYFFKFGRDATILSPLSLSTLFMNRYEQALDNYKTYINLSDEEKDG